jgi:FtsZ-binding cell division protein ZapB
MRESVGKVKECELLKIEVGELKSLNTTLKSKLQEAQESLKSNENLITYLNK